MKKIIVNKKNFDVRIDKFLAKEFFSLGMTRGEIIRKIKAGQILVNDKKVKPSYSLRLEDVVKSKIKNKRLELIANPNLEIKIIYQDENIIVVDKPAGISVHPSKVSEKNTLVNWLICKFPQVKGIYDNSKDGYLRPGVVHRLDKNTSGVMVVARNLKSFETLRKIFKEHKVEKKYLAIVCGRLENKSGIIEKPIARAGNYKKQVIAGRKTKTKIRQALTYYRVLKEFDDHSLLEVAPKTGRMHQIRVHLFSIGHPVAGDKLYKPKSREIAAGQKAVLAVGRQMLHAACLKFKLGKRNYNFEATLPPDMIQFIKILQAKPYVD